MSCRGHVVKIQNIDVKFEQKYLFSKSFAKLLNDDLIPGIPNMGILGHWFMLWGPTELQSQDGQLFRDYGMPDGAEVTLVLRRLSYDDP